MKVRVTNIQRFSLHDGPGIRTTIFLKGCTLKCPWCANPENINFEIEDYYDYENKKSGRYGYDIDSKELEKIVLKDKVFYENNGGVTFSGGEPLMQIDNLEDLLINLKNKNVNICMETALFVKKEFLEKALKYIDTFFVDIKILDKDECKNILNGDINLYYENLNLLFKNNCNVIFRIPMINEYTLTPKNVELIFQLLNRFKPKEIQVFKIHNLAEHKYKTLNKKIEKYQELSTSEVEEFINQIKKLNINVKEIKL